MTVIQSILKGWKRVIGLVKNKPQEEQVLIKAGNEWGRKL